MGKEEETKKQEEETKESKEERKLDPREEKLPVQPHAPVPGTEEESADDVAMPRLRLLQSTSTECQEGGSEAGTIKHSLSGEEYERIEIIPLFLRKSRIRFDPDNIKGPPICFAPDAKRSRSGNFCLTQCPFDNAHLWKGNEPPECDLVKSFPCLLLKDGKLEGDFASASFVKSSTAASQKLIYLRWKSGKPYWDYVYELFTRQKTFTKGTAYIFDIQQVRETKVQERKNAEAIFSSISKKPVAEVEVAGGEDAF